MKKLDKLKEVLTQVEINEEVEPENNTKEIDDSISNGTEAIINKIIDLKEEELNA